EAHRLEAVIEPRACGFRDIAFAPEFRRETPADLDGSGWKQARHMVGAAQADETYALAGGGDFRSRPAEALPGDRCAEFVHLAVGGRPVAPEREKFHHPLVGVDAMKEIAVAFLPVAQDQPFGTDGLHGTNCSCR